MVAGRKDGQLVDLQAQPVTDERDRVGPYPMK